MKKVRTTKDIENHPAVKSLDRNYADGLNCVVVKKGYNIWGAGSSIGTIKQICDDLNDHLEIEEEDLDLIEIIRKHSLVVRCLPYEVHERWFYREGQELKEGEELTYWKPDIEYFKNSFGHAEKRMEAFSKRFPNGRAVVHRVRKVEKGGWWYVKQVQDTGSTVRFNRKYDKFFAPTLEEAIELFLNDLK